MAAGREPDFRNLETVLRGGKPGRPTMFEYFLNERLYTRLSGLPKPEPGDDFLEARRLALAFAAAGYDHVTLSCPWAFPFTAPETALATRSLNRPPVIGSLAELEGYPWPDPGAYDYSYVDRAALELPGGMGIVMAAADGILETAVALTGYENLCFLLYDDEPLVEALFERIGEAILGFYRRVLGRPGVRAILCNDDWGFQSQTLLPPAQLRKLVFPWYGECCRLAHESGRPAILHSCGAYRPILQDIVEMGFDARHSYEDKIVPVEEAYPELRGRLAVLGGIDVDFLCRSSPEAVTRRARALLELTGCEGYALGSGNSIPDYVPDGNYFAMCRPALEG